MGRQRLLVSQRDVERYERGEISASGLGEELGASHQAAHGHGRPGPGKRIPRSLPAGRGNGERDGETHEREIIMKVHEAQAIRCDVFVETACGQELIAAIGIWAKEADRVPAERFSSGIIPEGGPYCSHEDIDWGPQQSFKHISRVRIQEREFGHGLVFTVNAGTKLAYRLVERFLGMLRPRLSPKVLALLNQDEELLAARVLRDAAEGI